MSLRSNGDIKCVVFLIYLGIVDPKCKIKFKQIQLFWVVKTKIIKLLKLVSVIEIKLK